MAIKRVLLPLVGTGIAEPLARCAFGIGCMHQAQVRALVLQREPQSVDFPDRAESADLQQEFVAEARREREQAILALAAPYQPLELEVSIKSGDIAPTVAHAARLSDIAVIGAGSGFDEARWRDVCEAALFQSGRPVMVVPRMGVEERAFERIVIAWKESIEAARAVAAAQPFLERAREVHLVTVGESERAVQSLEDVEKYLQLHYSEVRSEVVPYEPRAETADTLLDRAQARGDALLVMGAYSHWRWREQVFGGVTEAVLARAWSPVLMAH